MQSLKPFVSDRYTLQYFVALLDFILVFSIGIIAHIWRFDTFEMHEVYWLANFSVSLLVVLFNGLASNYSHWRSTDWFQIIWRLFLVWCVVGLVLATFIFYADVSQWFSRLWLGTTLLVSFSVIVVFRVLVLFILIKYRTKGKNRRHVFLIGPGENLLKTARQMRDHREEGFSIAGVHRFNSDPSVSTLDKITRRVNSSGAKEVWICLPLEMGSTVQSLMYSLRNETADVRFLPQFTDIALLNHRVSEVAGMYAIDLSVSPMTGFSRLLKRIEDLVIGSVISLLILPLCIFIALTIKLTSPGPILFKQQRTGINGKNFKVYKFRSMKVHNEESNNVTQATKGDVRITPIGLFLRKTSLDELPQFLNVLQGRMSIVGPRPHALVHNNYYKDLVESYMRRHKVKPGITGWAQVNGYRGETDTLEKMQKRVEYDLWYIDNWNLRLDFKIIILTVFKGFINKNAY